MSSEKRNDVEQVSSAWLKDTKYLEAYECWQEHIDDPCMVWKMEREGRVLTKAQTVINRPIELVRKRLKDPFFPKQMCEDVQRMEVLEEYGEELKVVFMKMKGLGPVSSRQVILANSFVQESPSKFYLGNKSIHDYPCDFFDDDSVRADIIINVMIFEVIDQTSTRMTAFNDFDLKGMIPDFIKNILVKGKASDIVQMEALIPEA